MRRPLGQVQLYLNGDCQNKNAINTDQTLNPLPRKKSSICSAQGKPKPDNIVLEANLYSDFHVPKVLSEVNKILI